MLAARNTLYWQFDDQNPTAFMYGPGWSNTTDSNAHDSTLSYTSEKTNVTIQFYGKSMWLYGVLGRTEEWNQPVYSYILDNRHISTIVAESKNETSYNQLLAYIHGLDSSNHTLIVENVNEGATLFLDYYLVEPMSSNESSNSVGDFPTGGEPLSTSISEHPMVAMTPGLSWTPSVGTIVGAVVGSVLGALLIVITAWLLWRRRKSSKPYYYKSATVYEVLSDEFETEKKQPKQDSEAPPVSPHPSIHSLSSDRASAFSFPRQTYFPTPSEYQSQNLFAKSNSTRSHSSTHTSSRSPTPDPASSHEQRPLL